MFETDPTVTIANLKALFIKSASRVVEVKEETGTLWHLLIVIFAGVDEDGAMVEGEEESVGEAAQKNILVELF